jgi:hypothetical protein
VGVSRHSVYFHSMKNITLILCAIAIVTCSAALGGYKPVSTTDPSVLAASDFAWQQIAASDSRVDLSVASNLAVISAAKQIVAGTNYKLTLNGKFDEKSITVDAIVYQDLQGNYKLSSYQVTIADQALSVGGYKPVSVTGADVQAAADFAWTQVAAADSRVDLSTGTGLTVASAAKQVVSGTNYKLSLVGYFSGAPITVNAVVYRNLQGEYSLSSYKVIAAQNSNSLPGGYTPASTSDADVQAAADFAWKEVAAADSRIDLSTGTGLTVSSAARQVVAGISYKLSLVGVFSGTTVTVNVVVYKSLQGDFTLSSYEAVAPQNSVRSFTGGYAPASVTDPDVQAAADFAWKQIAAVDARIDLSSGSGLTIQSASKQVVAGANFKLILSGYFGAPLTVIAIVYQDLQSNLSLTSFKVLPAQDAFPLAGGFQPVDTSDPNVLAAADFAWEQVAAADTRIDLTIGTNLEIESAAAQVVAGTNYKLVLSGEFSGAPISVIAVVFKSLQGDLTLKAYQVLAADNGPIVGGYSPISVDDPEVVAAADFAWKTVSTNAELGLDISTASNLKIISAKSQVVNGVNFQLELSGNFNGLEVVLDAVVFRSISQTYSLTKYQVREFLPLTTVGGYQPVDTTSLDVTDAANWLWQQAAKISGSGVDLTIGKNLQIISAHEQIVAGVNFKVTVQGDFGDKTVLISAVVFKSLQGTYSISSFDIHSSNTQEVLASVGGYQPVDTTSPDIQNAANWLWEQVAQVVGSGIDLSIGNNLKIVSAQEQVVAGINYKITVSGNFAGKTVVVDAVIFKNLQGVYSLSSYDIHVLNSVKVLTEIGGYQPADPSSLEVQNAANWLWEQMAQMTGTGVDLSIGSSLRIISVQQQIVNGVNYKITVTGDFKESNIIVNAVIYKNLQGAYSLTDYDIHISN